ncbi:MAG: hypothetical protein HC875_29390 [Anaerolineales bacterium]|nr:hypothetical protein [Anaerolineales bacterium]
MAPALHHSLTFEPALVETLLRELKDEKGEIHPPQIQLVCSALYNLLSVQQQADPNFPDQITQQMYEAEGRAEGILHGHLKRVLAQNWPTKQEQDLARQVLVALVSADGHRVRRTRSNLARELAYYIVTAQGIEEVRQQLDPLLSQLVKSRLLNVAKDEETDESSYELVHDYLLTEIKIDPELRSRKVAQEMLDQVAKNYQRFGPLLNEEQFNIINRERKFLVVNEAAAELLQKARKGLKPMLALKKLNFNEKWSSKKLWLRNNVSELRPRSKPPPASAS